MLLRGLLSRCGVQASHCGGLFAEHGLQGTWVQQLCRRDSVAAVPRLYSTGSIVVAHGLGSPMACGIFSRQGSNPCLLHWQTDSLPVSHQGKPKVNISIKDNHTDLQMVIFRAVCSYSRHWPWKATRNEMWFF